LCAGLIAPCIHFVLLSSMANLKRHIQGRGHTLLTCTSCGKEFSRPNAHIRSSTHSCSRECARKVRVKKPKTMLELVCKKCGGAFQRRLGAGGTMEYCSIGCSTLATTPKREDHPNWKGGISARSHSTKSVIKKLIQSIGKCEKCGSTHSLQGHHKLPHSTHPELRDNPENIEVLCASCHSLEHPTLSNMIQIPRIRSGATIKCEACGTERYVAPHKVNSARFCSRKCSSIDALKIARSKRKCFRAY
jgi:hypothetical protein